MSVIKSNRSLSSMEFLHNARALQSYTIKKCVGFPKRYSFFISEHLVAAATRVYEDVKRGNSIYPVNQHEVQIRRDYFLNAKAELESLISQIELAQETIKFDVKIMEEWMDLVDYELRLVQAVLKTERKKYANIP